MPLYDIITFPDGFEVPKDLEKVPLTENHFQTKNLFSTVDVYKFKKVSDEQVSENINGKYALHRMAPPLFKITTHNEGRIKDLDFDEFDEYADYWTRLRNGTGYMNLTLVSTEKDRLYSVFVLVEDTILKDIFVVYSNKVGFSSDGMLQNNNSDVEFWRNNIEKERKLKEDYSSVVKS